jgi:hypothetical protein
MFTVTNKIRTLVALGAVGATVGSAAVASAAPVSPIVRSTAVVSAAMVGRGPVTISPIVVNQPLIAHVSPVKGAASVGIAGYDDATCASLAQDNNTAVASGDQAQAAGDTDAAISNYNLAENIYNQMSDNCMVID